MPRIGVGLIGVGKHGGRYASHLLADVPSLKLVALWRRDFAAACEQASAMGCTAYHDVDDLIRAPEVDAVAVVVPPTLHRELVCAAADAHKPILLEKPAAPTVAEGDAMRQAVRRGGVPVLMAQTLRFNSVVRTLVRECSTIGEIHAMRLVQRFEPSRPGWIDDPRIAGGGIVLHTGVHSFDLLRLLSGDEIARVSCTTTRVSTKSTEDNFIANLIGRSSRMLVSVAGSRATTSRSGGIEMAGANGQLVADHVHGIVARIRGSHIERIDVPPPVPTVREVLEEFARVIKGAAPAVTLEDGLRAVAIAEACYVSARTDAAATVPEI